jgi:hypothetical protein
LKRGISEPLRTEVRHVGLVAARGAQRNRNYGVVVFAVWSFTAHCEEFSYIKNVLLSAAIVSAFINHSGLSLKRVR